MICVELFKDLADALAKLCNKTARAGLSKIPARSNIISTAWDLPPPKDPSIFAP